MILQKDFHVIFALANVCGQDRTLLARLLLRIFRHEKDEAFLLMKLNEKEIKMEGRNKDTCLKSVADTMDNHGVECLLE